MSAFAAWAARNTLRPMRPKPLIPTRTGMRGPYLRTAAHHLDAVPVRVGDIGGVVARPVLRPRARGAVVVPAVGDRGGVRGVDGSPAGRLERDVPERLPRPAPA